MHERNLVGGAAHHQSHLRDIRHHFAAFANHANGIGDFLQFLWFESVLQIENLDDVIFVVAALLRVVERDVNGVGRDRLPVSFGEDRKVIERFFERGVGEVDRIIFARVLTDEVWIEHHVDACHFGESFKQHFDRLVVHLEVDDFALDRLQHRRIHHGFELLLAFFADAVRGSHSPFFRRRGLSGLLILPDHLEGLAHALFGDCARGVKGKSALKQSQGFFELAFGADSLAAIDDLLGGMKTHPVEAELISGVPRINAQRLLEEFQGFFVVAFDLRKLRLFHE